MRTRVAAWLPSVLLAASACTTQTRALEAPAAQPHTIRLYNFAKQPRLPYAKLTIGAAEGWFLVDTGASRHVMGSAFFHQAFPGRALGRVTAAALSWAGKPQPMSEARDVPVTWADGLTDELDFAVGDFLPPASQSGMVGVISPQRLASRVELDFPSGELRWPAGSSAGVVYTQADRTLYVCGSHSASVYGWATAINGVPMWGLLDTGAVLTGLSLRHPMAAKLLPANGGTPVAMDDAARTPVISVKAPAWGDFGGRQWKGHIVLMQMERSPCDFPAVIGMDVLSQCRITLAGGQASALCGSQDFAPRSGTR